MENFIVDNLKVCLINDRKAMARIAAIEVKKTIDAVLKSKPQANIVFASSPYLVDTYRLVNTFSDSLLSRDFEGRIVVTVEPFNWREIIKVLLDAGGIVKAVDEGENALRRFLPGAEPADGVYQLLLED